MVMAYPVTEGETPPLPVQVFLAWHGMREHLAHKKFSGDYRMAVNRLRDFATINLSGNERGGAMENLGAILLAHKNQDILDRLTTPDAKGNAPFTAAELDMKTILWWGVQLAGNPRLFYTKKASQPLLSVERISTSPLARPLQKEGYVVLDGPALKLPELPTEDLKEMHGDSISALARMALICFAAGKITAAKWARQHGKIVEAETYRHAVEHGQVNFLRQISIDSEEVKRTNSYEALRQLDLQLLTARDRKEQGRSMEEGDVLGSFRLLSQAASDEQLKAIMTELAARKGMVVVPVTSIQSALQLDVPVVSPAPQIPSPQAPVPKPKVTPAQAQASRPKVS